MRTYVYAYVPHTQTVRRVIELSARMDAFSGFRFDGETSTIHTHTHTYYKLIGMQLTRRMARAKRGFGKDVRGARKTLV